MQVVKTALLKLYMHGHKTFVISVSSFLLSISILQNPISSNSTLWMCQAAGANAFFSCHCENYHGEDISGGNLAKENRDGVVVMQLWLFMLVDQC